ncbi:DUF4231 domain-containing protein [Micromonospora phytophila]|uniref:DUF4231 domain-containing protein n=1 Tax=Micromonospora phytophila TaxID=709888 RepID=UPI00202F1AC9|nr:DUF4231 domain-containing protein [Micromonospora phytophila]MCM0674669.1 DUF4231 domain-containing protein [Micromonospora phytophila]
MKKPQEPIQSEVPRPALEPLELALDLVHRIERGNQYARSRKRNFIRRASLVRLASLTLSVASTIILGLQNLEFWTGLAFALVAVATVVNTVEPFFAWRSRWVLMEECQYKFYRLRDEVTYYIASNKPEELEAAKIRAMFDQYQGIWDELGSRWLEYRRSGSPGQ